MKTIIGDNMDKDLIIEAFAALIEKQKNEIDEVYSENDYYFSLWIALIDYIGKNWGREAISSLSNEYKEKLQGYINDNFDNK